MIGIQHIINIKHVKGEKMNVKDLLKRANLRKIAKKEAAQSWELNCDQIKTEEEKDDIRKKMTEYIYENYQKVLQIVPEVEEECIVYCVYHKNLLHEEDSYLDASMIHKKDLVEKEIPIINFDSEEQETLSQEEYEKKYIQNYAFEFEPWCKILGYEVANASIEEYETDEVASAILNEMTFFGYEEKKASEYAKEEIDILNDRIQEIKKHPDRTIPAEKVFSDLRKEFGWEEPTKEEEEETHQRIIEELKINQQEKIKILEKMKKDYV